MSIKDTDIILWEQNLLVSSGIAGFVKEVQFLIEIAR